MTHTALVLFSLDQLKSMLRHHVLSYYKFALTAESTHSALFFYTSSLWVLLCVFKFKYSMESSSQCLQQNWFSAMCVPLCLPKYIILKNILSHCVHLNNFFPVCMPQCCVQLQSEKRMWQKKKRLWWILGSPDKDKVWFFFLHCLCFCLHLCLGLGWSDFR